MLHYRYISFFLLAVFFLALLSPVNAANGWRKWKEGQVTQEVWTDNEIDRIKIDDIPYAFMPDAIVYKVSEQKNGGYSEDPVAKRNIDKSDNVEILVQGFRIYQLRILP